jgi:hypothetical protein
VHQDETQNSLQGRINDYLRDKPREFAVEVSEAAAVEAIYDMLKKEEENLNAAKKRVDRLKWELLKIDPQHTQN